MKTLFGNFKRASDKSLLRAPELNIAKEQAARMQRLQDRRTMTTIRPEKRSGLLRRQP